jgi:hypothetical protein
MLSKIRAFVALTVASSLLCLPARALVTLNDGKDHIFVTGTVSMAYDSNIYDHAGSDEGDTIYSSSLLIEYTRKAGWIGVNGSIGLDVSHFDKNSNEDFSNPKFSLELNKTTGRTTGALTLSAARENQADDAANLRTQSWNYAADLNFKYPVIERYSISGDIGYTDCVYDNTTVLSNLSTYTAGADLLYAFTSERDLMAGYRYRYSETSSDSAYDDNSFTAGVSGKIFSSLNGSIRAGYEFRSPRGRATDGSYSGLTASAAVTWTATKHLTFTGQLSKDTSVTSTDLSVDTLSADLNAQYVFNAKLSLSADTGVGESRFLGLTGDGRHDEYFTWGCTVNYTLLAHLKASLGYTYYQNWSTLSYADYTRNSFTLTLTSRW